MPAYLLGRPSLLGNPKPINWQGVGQALWDTNLMAPIRGAYNQMNADPYTLYTDEGAAGQQAVADSFDAAGGITVGSMPMPKPSNALTMGIKAYHGSPHSFDKFSMDKIGTGEGAQAYGHGLYFAEKEDIARSYRDALSPAVIDGKPVDYGVGNELASSWYTAFKDRGKAADYLQRQLDNPPKSLPNFRSPEEIQATKDAIVILRSDAPISETKPSGSMYEVNIDADPNAFLDWDKPLNEQPPQMTELVRQALKDKGYLRANDNGPRQLTSALKAWRMAEGGMAETSMEALLGGRGGMLGQTAEEASAKLRNAGIPGIKYLDAGSRGAGDGTRNYVVFDDKLISIVKKYGIAGASAMVGYNVLQGLDKAQAATLNKADLDHKYDQFLRSGGI